MASRAARWVARLLSLLCTVSAASASLANLTVQSSGFESSNIANFYMNSVKLPVVTSRGMNVLVLRPGNSVYHTFDTHPSKAGAVDLADFLESLENGTLVLVAARDDAAANLDLQPAQQALASLGARLAKHISYRGAYALAAIKGVRLLAEASKPFGTASITIFYDVGSQDLGLHPAPLTVLNPGLELRVESAGYADGNRAKFYIAQQPLPVRTGRGMNVLLLSQRGLVQASYVFDTWANSQGLVALIKHIPNGQLLMLAAQDDAFHNLTSNAIAAVESLGARQIRNISYRASYALVVAKGKQVCEGLSAEGQGAVRLLCTIKEPAWMTFPLQVLSGGWEDGNFVEFHVNESTPAFRGGRGINVVVLRRGGQVLSTATFDTHQNAGSACMQLAQLLYPLPPGSPVMVAVQDDAGLVTSNCLSAMRSIGALAFKGLGYRSSYALVGIKGGDALSETSVPAGKGTAQALVEFADEPFAGGLQTAPPARCYDFPCSRGEAISPETWNLTTLSISSCCSALGDDLGLMVQSGGFDDGNMAVFQVNGRLLALPSGRGINLLLLKSDGSIDGLWTFDTHGKEEASSALCAFLRSVANGTVVLIAVQDDASANLTLALRKAMPMIGATQFDTLSFRDSYALIGVKGGRALSEHRSPHGAGLAVVLARKALPEGTKTTTEAPTATNNTNTTFPMIFLQMSTLSAATVPRATSTTAMGSVQLNTSTSPAPATGLPAVSSTTTSQGNRISLLQMPAEFVTGTITLAVQDRAAFCQSEAAKQAVQAGLASIAKVEVGQVTVAMCVSRLLRTSASAGLGDLKVGYAIKLAAGSAKLAEELTAVDPARLAAAIIAAAFGDPAVSGLQVGSITAAASGASPSSHQSRRGASLGASALHICLAMFFVQLL